MYTFKKLQKNWLSLDQCLGLTPVDRKCYADDVTLPAQGTGTTTPVIATDEVSSRHFQKIKLVYGADGAATDTTTSAGFPVQIVAGSASIGVLGSNSGVDIGDVTINNASGASAVNIQDGGNTITVDGTISATIGDGSNVPEVTTAGTDGSTNSKNGIAVYARTQLFNASTWDRLRSIINANNSTGTGIIAAGLIAQLDNISPTTITENQFGNLRMSDERSLHVETRDARGREFGIEVNFQGRQVVQRAADGVTISGNVLLEQQRQPINVSSDGQILVSGLANRKIRVLNGGLMAPTAVTIGLKSNNNTDLSGPLPFGAN